MNNKFVLFQSMPQLTFKSEIRIDFFVHVGCEELVLVISFLLSELKGDVGALEKGVGILLIPRKKGDADAGSNKYFLAVYDEWGGYDRQAGSSHNGRVFTPVDIRHHDREHIPLKPGKCGAFPLTGCQSAGHS